MYLLPKPKSVEKKQGIYEISYAANIVIDSEIPENGRTYAAILQECIKKASGIRLAVRKGSAGPGDILLTTSAELGEQEYRLLIREDGITVAGGDGAGTLYGVQTLCQIVKQSGGVIECMEIVDAPDVKNRGYFLDESRGRVLKLSYLKKVADRLCRYKINQFQLYVEHTYLFQNLSEMWRDETPLTAEDILELDSYCRERHIELIPCLASFGHLYTLLHTKSYGDLCEFPDAWKEPFSFWDRMRHHTINVTDKRSMPLIKGMLEEYLSLFSSDKCNICADETFDLGRGMSKETAEKEGVHRMYINYVRELCEFLAEKGKQPMFWGDIICGEPFLIKELPENTICLTWGYDKRQREDECMAMAEAGARQYLCPGVAGWNQWMNLIENSYKNITRMCAYAHKHGAEGILNTDWGDCGHVNHPEYSVPGMIYGASFSWNLENIGFDEINRHISVLEYGDTSEKLAGLMAQTAEQSIFSWWDAIVYYEKYVLNHEPPREELLPGILSVAAVTGTDKVDGLLCSLRREMKPLAVQMAAEQKQLIAALDITMEGIRIWNEIGVMLYRRENGEDRKEGTAELLAERLEKWFMSYKELWRSISLEGDLHHVADIMFWYANLLRGADLR